MASTDPVHVAVGVLRNADDEVLIARRHPDSHQGGLWEFPGGKVEPGEAVMAALQREFREELGLNVHKAFPLLRTSHRYADKTVLLDIWNITDYTGQAQGLEGQAIAWRHVAQLRPEDFPAANKGIIRTLNLPPEMAITPQLGSLEELERLLAPLLKRGIGMIQLRQPQLDRPTYMRWYQQALAICRQYHCRLLFNHATGGLPDIKLSGYHSNSRELMDLDTRPVTKDILYSASCHNAAQLRHAERLGVDLALLSPVLSTAKYRDEQLLGWRGFEALAAEVGLPVYALGGMQRSNLALARQHGAFGVAGIRGFF